MLRFLRRLRDEENGQGLLFGVVSLFILCLCVSMVYNVGQVSTNRIRVQTAADTAAVAGALVEADIASSIAWMNDGMAYVYYHLMRYAVDVIVYGTLLEFKKHSDLIADLPEIDDDDLGVADVETKYNRAYALASHWIPKGEGWLEKISGIEEGLLIAGNLMIKQEIFRVATENGADYVTVWPDIELYRGHDSDLTIIIERIGNGWRLRASNGYECEVIQIGPERWQITVNDGTVVVVGKIADDPASYEISVNDGTSLRATELPGLGWAVTGFAAGKSISYSPVPTYGDGAYRISSGGSSAVVRQGDGGLEQYSGGKWQPLAGEDTVNVGGTEIPIHQSGTIEAGNAEIDLPNRVILDGTEIVLGTDDVDLYAHIGMASLRIEDNEVVVNHLSNLTHDDGKWRTWVGPHMQGHRYSTGGRWRHRMTEDSPTTWTYEYQAEGPHFGPDDYHRFSVLHALYDNLPFDPSNPDMPGKPGWTRWFDTETGHSYGQDSRLDAETTFHQTRTCWHPKDLMCPVHGLACAPNRVRPCGYWHEIDGDGNEQTIDCPCCNHNDGMHGYYHQLGRDLDGDGKTDVRFYQYDSRPHPGRTRNDPDYQSIDLHTVARPKVLRDEFFAFQINVGCYIEPRNDDLLQLLFEDPPWGYFAVASARSGFHDVTVNAYRSRFDTIEDREEWLASSANLYEPDWHSWLSSSRKAIKDEDLDVLAGVETSVNWVFKGMAWHANWRDEYNGVPNRSVNAALRGMSRPNAVDDFFDPMHLTGTKENPFSGSRYDLSDLRLKDNVHH